MYRALQHYDFSRAIPFKRYLYFLIRSVKYDYLRKSRAERHRHVAYQRVRCRLSLCIST